MTVEHCTTFYNFFFKPHFIVGSLERTSIRSLLISLFLLSLNIFGVFSNFDKDLDILMFLMTDFCLPNMAYLTKEAYHCG